MRKYCWLRSDVSVLNAFKERVTWSYKGHPKHETDYYKKDLVLDKRVLFSDVLEALYL